MQLWKTSPSCQTSLLTSFFLKMLFCKAMSLTRWSSLRLISTADEELVPIVWLSDLGGRVDTPPLLCQWLFFQTVLDNMPTTNASNRMIDHFNSSCSILFESNANLCRIRGGIELLLAMENEALEKNPTINLLPNWLSYAIMGGNIMSLYVQCLGNIFKEYRLHRKLSVWQNMDGFVRGYSSFDKICQECKKKRMKSWTSFCSADQYIFLLQIVVRTWT